MKTKDFIEKQRRIFNEIKTKNLPLQRAADAAHRLMVTRIFSEGGAVQGKIGNYNSTDPLYVNPKNSPKSFSKRGKVSTSSKFKNGKERKTGFFDSYKDFRDTIGRPTGTVNLNLSSDLELDFSNTGKTTEISPLKRVSTIDRDENIKKAEGNEKHFGKKIFDLTAAETKEFNRILELELALIFDKL